MTIDDRWDKLSDEAWSNFARDWLLQLLIGQQEGEKDLGLSVVIMGHARPELQWKFILEAIRHAETDDELGHIAAGPIEHLLGNYGDDYISKVEAQSVFDSKFAAMMTGAWQHIMSDEVWVRVQAIQSTARKLQYSKKDE